jgi:hypothetical protein
MQATIFQRNNTSLHSSSPRTNLHICPWKVRWSHLVYNLLRNGEYANKILESRRPASSVPAFDRRVIDSAEFWKSQAAEYLDQVRDLKGQVAQLKDANRQLRKSIPAGDGSQSSADDVFRGEPLEHLSSVDVSDEPGHTLTTGRKRKLRFQMEDPAEDVFEDGSDQIISGYSKFSLRTCCQPQLITKSLDSRTIDSNFPSCQDRQRL